MEWGNILLTLVTGIFLRFALPVGATILVVLWLRWLDARWQKEAEQTHPPVETWRGVPASGRCWSVMGCPEERRRNCPAYQNGNVPCWQLFRKPDGRLREECLACRMFREAPVPVPM